MIWKDRQDRMELLVRLCFKTMLLVLLKNLAAHRRPVNMVAKRLRPSYRPDWEVWGSCYDCRPLRPPRPRRPGRGDWGWRCSNPWRRSCKAASSGWASGLLPGPLRIGTSRMRRRSRDRVCCCSGTVRFGSGWNPGRAGAGRCGSGHCRATCRWWRGSVCTWRWSGSASLDWKIGFRWAMRSRETDVQIGQEKDSNPSNLLKEMIEVTRSLERLQFVFWMGL